MKIIYTVLLCLLWLQPLVAQTAGTTAMQSKAVKTTPADAEAHVQLTDVVQMAKAMIAQKGYSVFCESDAYGNSYIPNSCKFNSLGIKEMFFVVIYDNRASQCNYSLMRVSDGMERKLSNNFLQELGSYYIEGGTALVEGTGNFLFSARPGKNGANYLTYVLLCVR